MGKYVIEGVNNFNEVTAIGDNAVALKFGNMNYQKLLEDIDSIKKGIDRTKESVDSTRALILQLENAVRNKDEQSVNRILKKSGQYLLDFASNVGANYLTGLIR